MEIKGLRGEKAHSRRSGVKRAVCREATGFHAPADEMWGGIKVKGASWWNCNDVGVMAADQGGVTLTRQDKCTQMAKHKKESRKENNYSL